MYLNSNYKSMSNSTSNYSKPLKQIINNTTTSTKPSHVDRKPITLKYDILKDAHPSNPEVWGPSFWFILHNGAIHYPDNPSNIEMKRMKGFIRGIPVMIPCVMCSKHALSYILASVDMIDYHVSKREHLFKFFVDFHNFVNTQKNKPSMTLKSAYDLYSSNKNVKRMVYP